MNRQRFLLPALLLLTLARFIMLALHPLSQVEKYTLACSSEPWVWHAGMSPFLPILMKVSTFIFGTSAFGVRFFAPLLILGASVALWRLASGLFDATTASWAVVIFQFTPLVNLASVTFTPATLGIVLSVVLLILLRLALHRHHPWHLYWWCLAIAVSLVICIDWRFGMFIFATLAALLLTERGQRALQKWPVMPILGGCTALILTLYFSWNSERGWLAFRIAPDSTNTSYPGMVLQALLVFSPLLLAAYGWALSQSVLKKPIPYSVAFLYAFSWPLLTLDLLIWPTLPWPQGGLGAWLAPSAILLSHHALTHEPKHPQWKLWSRFLVLTLAGIQSCVLLHGTLVKSWGFEW